MRQSASVTESRSPKRARIITQPPTANHRSLPVVGWHIALIGPPHLTQLFAASLSKRDTVDRSDMNLQDRVVLQQLERRSASLMVTEQRYVHLLEKDTQSLPHPCHIVYVIACDPRTIDPDHFYRHANIQHALRDCHHHHPTQITLLLCFDINAPTLDTFLPASCMKPTVLTCWHPQNESSRQSIAQSLWKHCRLSQRVAPPSPWLYETIE